MIVDCYIFEICYADKEMDGEAILADKWTKFTVGYKMLLTFNTLQSLFINVKIKFQSQSEWSENTCQGNDVWWMYRGSTLLQICVQ